MNKRTLKALRGSIKKWERIVTGHEIDEGSDNCPLCHEFRFDKFQKCQGCPVMEATDRPGCIGTPYEKFTNTAFRENQKLVGYNSYSEFDSHAVAGPRAQRAAIKEYKFLVSLLPPGAKP